MSIVRTRNAPGVLNAERDAGAPNKLAALPRGAARYHYAGGVTESPSEHAFLLRRLLLDVAQSTVMGVR